MKYLKRILSIILVLAICIMPLEVHAAGKDVTSSMKKDKDIKKIVKHIGDYSIGVSKLSQKTKKVNLKGYNALSMAGYVGYHYKKKNSFTEKEIQNITYDLFGIKPKTSSIPSLRSTKRKWISKSFSVSDKPFQYSGGDWGSSTPINSIKKIVKVKKNVYDITVINKVKSRETKKTSKISTTYMRIKKNPKSSYHYNVISLKGKLI